MKKRACEALLLATLLYAAALASCGTRTGLLESADPPAGDEAGTDSQPDVVAPDRIVDTFDAHDAFEAAPDALPPIDVVPPSDAPSCPTGLTAYLFSDSNDLYSFDPPTLATHRLGPLACPTSATPWTMTASSSGKVYLLYEDWKIYQVDPGTLVCFATPYVPGQLSLGGFDGITVSPDDGGERLYVYGQAGGSSVLGVSDLFAFVLSEVGVVVPQPSEFPLDVRADPFGRIFGLGSGGTFDEIDRSTAALIAEDKTSFAGGGSSWALLTYNHAIYFFAGGAVSQYDLAAKTLTPLGDVGVSVVGASAAPCIH